MTHLYIARLNLGILGKRDAEVNYVLDGNKVVIDSVFVDGIDIYPALDFKQTDKLHCAILHNWMSR